MNGAIIAAVIGAVASILVTIITVISTNSKTRTEIVTGQKLQEERQKALSEKVDDLAKDVKSHNEYGRKIPVIEEQIKVINHRLDDLERSDAK